MPQPAENEVPFLRRVARGFLLRTNIEGKGSVYTYEDGGPIPHFTKKGFAEDEARHVERMIRLGWLIPVDGERLFAEAPAQRYRARGPGDPVLPKFTRE